MNISNTTSYHRANISGTNARQENCNDQLPTDLQEVIEQLGRLGNKIDKLFDVVSGTTKPLYTVDEVARLTGRSPYTVRRWINEKRIRATRIADTGPRGRLLISRDELQTLISSGRGESIPTIA